MIKLPLHLKQMGESGTCGHRSGWPYAMSYLKQLQSPDGILLDDFVERTFQQTQKPKPWREPWIGVFHHPPMVPQWFEPSAVIETIFSTPAFQASMPYLRGIVTLSDYLGQYLRRSRKFDGIPVLTVMHPTEVPEEQWAPDKFLGERQSKKLVQVGWWLRNLQAIYQVQTPNDWTRIHLDQPMPWVQTAMKRVESRSPHKDRNFYTGVKKYPRLSNEQYDKLLASSVVFVELFDTSANNAVVECIARSTPIIVNVHPATREYLGRDYPLFFSEIQQVRGLLEVPRILAAHEYLRTMSKEAFSGEHFRDVVSMFVEKVRGSL